MDERILTGVRRISMAGWYAAFSVSKSLVPEVEAYIAGQPEHHRNKTFEEEYRTFLNRHGIQYDDRYLFDGEVVG